MLELATESVIVGMHGETEHERLDRLSAPPGHLEHLGEVEVEIGGASAERHGLSAKRHRVVKAGFHRRGEEPAIREMRRVVASVLDQLAQGSSRDAMQAGPVVVHGALEDELSFRVVHIKSEG